MADASAPPTDIVQEILNLLRERGWETGMRRVQTLVEKTSTMPSPRKELVNFMAGWMNTDRGSYDDAHQQFAEVIHTDAAPELHGWALAGLAYLAYRRNRREVAQVYLDQAEQKNTARDEILQATIAHYRGVLAEKQGDPTAALKHLHAALQCVGPDHLVTSRILDSLGMILQNSRNNLALARHFFGRSIQLKEKFEDVAGQALTHGQLGRLWLSWGDLRKSAHHFEQDLRLCERTGDRFGEAQMYNFLGQVLILQGNPRRALSFLEEGLLKRRKEWTILEAYIRKDKAWAKLEAALTEPNKVKKHQLLQEAEEEAITAEKIFDQTKKYEGVHLARRIRARVAAEKGQPVEESVTLLQEAAAYFDEAKDRIEAARTYLELARLLKANDRLAISPMKRALEQAEQCHRPHFLKTVEDELRSVDEIEYYKRLYERSRGQGIAMTAREGVFGEALDATVLFFDLRDSCGFASSADPEVVLQTLNHIFAVLTEILDRHDIFVNQYLGDGFMAFSRAEGHEWAAVNAAIELREALVEFNRPREVLKLRALKGRIGLYTGTVFLGSIGTHRKSDYTAIGTPTNKAARLQSEALDECGICIGEPTHAKVRADFLFKHEEGREVKLKGFDKPERVWDVIGRK